MHGTANIINFGHVRCWYLYIVLSYHGSWYNTWNWIEASRSRNIQCYLKLSNDKLLFLVCKSSLIVNKLEIKLCTKIKTSNKIPFMYSSALETFNWKTVKAHTAVNVDLFGFQDFVKHMFKMQSMSNSFGRNELFWYLETSNRYNSTTKNCKVSLAYVIIFHWLTKISPTY